MLQCPSERGQACLPLQHVIILLLQTLAKSMTQISAAESWVQQAPYLSYSHKQVRH